jgi:hypothetical protein
MEKVDALQDMSMRTNFLTGVSVEFVLSQIKVTACLGFIILGIIIDCGGVPTDPRGYIGGRVTQCRLLLQTKADECDSIGMIQVLSAMDSRVSVPSSSLPLSHSVELSLLVSLQPKPPILASRYPELPSKSSGVSVVSTSFAFFLLVLSFRPTLTCCSIRPVQTPRLLRSSTLSS